jgi:hypothetical protein
VREILTPTGYDPRTVQPSASHHNCLKKVRYDIEVARSSKFCNTGSITKYCNQIYELQPQSEQCVTDWAHCLMLKNNSNENFTFSHILIQIKHRDFIPNDAGDFDIQRTVHRDIFL